MVRAGVLMRVLHVHSGNLFGGVERILETLGRHWRLHPAMEPAFALSFEGRLSGQLRECEAPLDLIGPIRTRRPWEVRSGRRALAAVLDRRAPDVVVVHSSWTQALLGPAIQSAAVPLVRWLHAPEPGLRPLEWASARVPAALVICNSKYTCDASAGRFPGVPRTTCYPPIALDRAVVQDRATVRAELRTREDATVVVVAARMEPWKGHGLLIDALGRMVSDGRWRCWIAGGAQRRSETEYEQRLRDQAARHGIGDRVSFLGERRDVDRLLAAADIYCQPNVGSEPFGLSFVEALAAGLPVLSTRMGALPEIVDDTCGTLVEPHVADVAAALAAMMDPARRAELSRGARARAATFGDLPARLALVASALASAATSAETLSRPAL